MAYVPISELTEVMIQSDKKFIDLLNKIRVANVQKQIRERFIEESAINYPKNYLHMFAENYPTVKYNRKMLDKLPGKIYIVNAIDSKC